MKRKYSTDMWAFIIEKLGRDIPVVVELGTEYGFFARQFMENVGAGRFFGIDLFASTEKARLWTENVNRWIAWSVFPIREDALNVPNWFPHIVDFLYVDAGKQNDDVTLMLSRWVPRVRSGGLVIGHDYNLGGPRKGARRYFGQDRLGVSAWGPKPECKSYWVQI